MWHRDLFPFFRQPKETVITVPLGQSVQLCPINPDRVVLMIGTGSTQVLTISTVQGGPNNGGIQISADNQPLILSQSIHGSLAQVAWYSAGSAAGATFTIIELILDRKPTLEAGRVN